MSRRRRSDVNVIGTDKLCVPFEWRTDRLATAVVITSIVMYIRWIESYQTKGDKREAIKTGKHK